MSLSLCPQEQVLQSSRQKERMEIHKTESRVDTPSKKLPEGDVAVLWAPPPVPRGRKTGPAALRY